MTGQPLTVELTLEEMTHAAIVGCTRHHYAIIHGLRDAIGVNQDFDTSLARHINGAGGELAVAKALDRYWGGHVKTFKAADVGRDTQVRTRVKHDMELIVRDSDNPDHIYVLVTGQAPRYVVHGWIHGDKARQPQWRKTHGNLPAAYFVPHQALHPLINHLEDTAHGQEATGYVQEREGAA